MPSRLERSSGPPRATPPEGSCGRLDALSDHLIFRGGPILVAAGRLVTLACRRVCDAQAPVQPPVDIQRGSLIVLADHEDGDLPGRGKSEEDAPLPCSGQVDAADPLDLLARQPVVGGPATTACQVGLDAFHSAPNVRAQTPYVLFSDARPEDIETNGQLVGRLWT